MALDDFTDDAGATLACISAIQMDLESSKMHEVDIQTI